MAEPQEETPQEKETRWASQRATHEKEQRGRRVARQRKAVCHWVLVGATMLMGAVIAGVVLR
jgi:hypothetical protein